MDTLTPEQSEALRALAQALVEARDVASMEGRPLTFHLVVTPSALKLTPSGTSMYQFSNDHRF